jgi:DNA polymerase
MSRGLIESVSNYKEFRDKLKASDCQLCPLSKSRTQIVVDRGNPHAKVLFVGEAPGQNEDLQGKAFVGRSGRLLDQMLHEFGFDTERDALIANVVKCRPPKNRAPMPSEAQQCLPFLRQQIDLMKPKIVGLLGATAHKHLLPTKKQASMKDRVGKFFEHPLFPGIQLIILYHPAYILRDPRKRPVMLAHLRSLCDLWRKVSDV